MSRERVDYVSFWALIWKLVKLLVALWIAMNVLPWLLLAALLALVAISATALLRRGWQ